MKHLALADCFLQSFKSIQAEKMGRSREVLETEQGEERDARSKGLP